VNIWFVGGLLWLAIAIVVALVFGWWVRKNR
jgi:hypothetical protein